VLTLALPTGDLRAPVAAALAAAGLPCEAYAAGSRALRLTLADDGIAVRVFREKDIPIQIALGNYDLGICSAAWVEELHARHPQEGVRLLRPFAFDRRRLIVAGAPATLRRLGPPAEWSRTAGLRLVSEFPGLADLFARRLRLPRYTVLPVWGAAEAYPPEDADLVLLNIAGDAAPAAAELQPAVTLMEAPAWLIANTRSLATRDLGPVLGRLLALPPAPDGVRPLAFPRAAVGGAAGAAPTRPRETVRLALPDGHAQRHTAAALAAAGIVFEGYGERETVRRPRSPIAGLEVKVIRPQDMPQQVAIGHFDLAITGRDCLMDHRLAFPSSPVEEAVDLGLSRYPIAAAVSEEVPGRTLAEALAWWRARGVRTIRVASEYPHIADHFARAHHLGRYAVVPVSGASEAFVPEDAEILIEGTETGASFRANRLRVVERVLESTNCLIAHRDRPGGARGALIERLIEALRTATQAT
jgi:ATP phosphoribosyltransferase